MNWTETDIKFLEKNYPIKGKIWCAQKLGVNESRVRHKASALGLRAMGTSEAWLDGQIRAAKSKVGKKRPEQAEVMRRLNLLRKPLTDEDRKAMSERTKNYIAKNGHSRGMLGKVHSDEAKAKMSQSGQIRAKNETQELKEERVMKMMKTKSERNSISPRRPHGSWKSDWREIGGSRCYFRSRWEANYARYLQWLVDKKHIAKWEHEPETFWFDGIKRGCVSYLPDFRVTKLDGQVEYHEVKGWMDDRSLTKLKRMKKYHPNVKLILIDSPIYKKLSSDLKFLISGWE